MRTLVYHGELSGVSSMSPPPEPVWTEPPCSWFIETTEDALLILEAARRGLIPRVTRRLVDRERRMISSGSVFVFDEDESGIKRWTDGLLWSPSRILGNFLLYRETDKKGAQPPAESPLLVDARKESPTSLSRPKDARPHPDRTRERALVGSLTNSYKFKPDGMMKKVRRSSLLAITHISQTFSLSVNGSTQHLISYYKVADVEEGRLRTPSSLPELSVLDISPEYLDKTHFRCPPKVEYDPDGVPRYRGEADDPDSPARPTVHPPPPPPPQALLTDQSTLYSQGYYPDCVSNRVARRYEPYGPSSSSRRSRSRRGTETYRPSGSPEAEPGCLPAAPPQYQPYTSSYSYASTPAPTPAPASSYYSQQYSAYQQDAYSQPPPASSYCEDGSGYHSGSSYGYTAPTPAPPPSHTPAPVYPQVTSDWIARRDMGYPHHAHVHWGTEVHGS
ncbi:Global transcription regulator sge1 [Ceratobasidium theobromae]|uniref:Global transcription regulator sge1 n=1 Tax=Ceratobasidium theobromae TaxID=1582974 RepID=A0A5N5QI28_9AGAM|nr:Global transcription regulator sge1 [Ceratobasidium theobromae]